MNIQHSDSQLIISSRDDLIVYNVNSGEDHSVKVPPPSLPPNLTKGQLDVLNKQNRIINSLTVSRNGRYIAVSTENKQLIIYDNNLNVIRNLIVNRTASKVTFLNSGDFIVADRTGDVLLYKLSEENSEPTLLLGHLSMVLDVTLSECEKYIITCDRDEKIRVSHFPNTYNIVSYCLGHEEFVTTIKIVKDILISASGDGTIRIWNYLKGEQLNRINTNNFIGKTNLFEKFSKEMDVEKVDVTALPITDMQIYKNKNLFIAVALYHFDEIQLYKLNLETYESLHVKNVECVEIPHKFCLTDSLYILNNLKLIIFKLVGEDYVQTSSPDLEHFYTKYRDILKINDNNTITVLYKRKFDNVQEYLERKKLRLESSIKE